MFSKSDVNGPDTNEVYRYLRRNSRLHDKAKGKSTLIPWNFSKFVVSSQYSDMEYFDPSHNTQELCQYIERLLAQ